MSNPYEKLQDELKDTTAIVKEVSQGKRIGYYKIRGILGKGAFSEVKLGMHILLNEKVAVKIIEKGKHGCQTTLDMMRQEVSVMEKMNHPNIITLFEVIETLDKFYCVMEYVDGGSLQDYLTRKCKNGKCTVTEDTARFFFLQIIDAVEHMHNIGVYHRDLKNDNVLLASDKTIRIADFGISTCSSEMLTDYCGTPPCCPPEIFKRIPFLAAPMDIWTLGVLLYQLVDGTLPFRARNMEDLKVVILNLDYAIPDYFTDDLRDLIQKIFVENPEERLTVAQIQEHSWLTGAENDATFKEASQLYDEPVKDKLLSLGIPDGAVSDVMVKGCSRVGPRDSITGTYRIALHNLQTHNLHAIAYNRGARFSICPSPSAMLELGTEQQAAAASALHSDSSDYSDSVEEIADDEEEKKKKKCCTVM